MIDKLKYGLTFLSMPYSDKDKTLVEERFRKSTEVSAHLMVNGIHLLSPIGFGHPIVIAHPVPSDWDYWNLFCKKLINASSQLLVFTLPGWKESTGVQEEIEFAKRHHIPIYTIDEYYNIERYVL
jgi:hypothetical protein